MSIASLLLPFSFSEKRLLDDLSIAQTEKFVEHFNKNDYEGKWDSIALRSADGKSATIFANPSVSDGYKDTDLLQKCSYFKEVLDHFECDKESVRLLNLHPGSKIKEHTDLNLGYENGVFRIHIPISTNSKVDFYINGAAIVMEVGSCWYGNFNLPHWVENRGAKDRVHLVIDCLRNKWSDDLFTDLGYDFTEENETPEYSKETKLAMIESLKLQNSPAAIELIKQLQEELNNEA